MWSTLPQVTLDRGIGYPFGYQSYTPAGQIPSYRKYRHISRQEQGGAHFAVSLLYSVVEFMATSANIYLQMRRGLLTDHSVWPAE